MSRNITVVLTAIVLVAFSISAPAATSAQTAKDIKTAGIVPASNGNIPVYNYWPNDWFMIQAGPHKGDQLAALSGGSNAVQSAYVIGFNGPAEKLSGTLYIDTDQDSATGIAIPQFDIGADYLVKFTSTSATIVRAQDGVTVGEAKVILDGQELVLIWDNTLTANLGNGNSHYGVVLATGEYAPDDLTVHHSFAFAPGRLTVIPGPGLIDRVATEPATYGPPVIDPIVFQANLEMNVGDIDGNWTDINVRQVKMVVDGIDATTSFVLAGTRYLGIVNDRSDWYDLCNYGRQLSFKMLVKMDSGWHTVTVIADTDRGVLADTTRIFVRTAYNPDSSDAMQSSASGSKVRQMMAPHSVRQNPDSKFNGAIRRINDR